MFLPDGCYSSFLVNDSGFCICNLSLITHPSSVQSTCGKPKRKAVLCKSAVVTGAVFWSHRLYDGSRSERTRLDIISKLTPLLFVAIYFHIFAVPPESSGFPNLAATLLLTVGLVDSIFLDSVSAARSGISITTKYPIMPGKILPTFTPAEVESHNHAKSCFVTLGSKVYDVTSFLNDHPGGGDLILEYAGKDVKEILRDESSHNHSEAAYEILEDLLVGFLDNKSTGKTADANGSATVGSEEDSRPVYASTGMSSEEDLSVETDIVKDYQTFKFLDLNKPLLLQLWNSGFSKEFYLQQIHRPRHYKGGESAPLFGNFLEPLSKTAWYVVPLLWLPPVTYGSFVGFAGLGNVPTAASYWLFGLFLWTLIEYLMHRFLFHIDGYVIYCCLPF